MTQQPFTTVETPILKFIKFVLKLGFWFFLAGVVTGEIDARTGIFKTLGLMFWTAATTNPVVGVPFFGFIFFSFIYIIVKVRNSRKKQEVKEWQQPRKL